MSEPRRVAEPDSDAARVLEHAADLLARGDVGEAMAALRESCAEAHDSPAVLEAARDFRHQAFSQTRFTPRVPAGQQPQDGVRFAEPAVPEIDSDELDATVMAEALGQRGCLLVRGLLAPETAADLRDLAERVIAARDSLDGEATDAAGPLYVPFEASEGYSFGPFERAFTQQLGGVLTIESPAALAAVIEAFCAVGLDSILEDYLGERPVLSAKKSTLRRAAPTSPTEWHQDGAFLGADTPSVNVWVALTRCGTDAPSIDVVPHAYDRIIQTGGDRALFDWSVSSDVADAVATVAIDRPEFEPGDALIFDQLTLHRSGISAEMTETRYAIESWFFGPTSYPHEQIPVLF